MQPACGFNQAFTQAANQASHYPDCILMLLQQQQCWIVKIVPIEQQPFYIIHLSGEKFKLIKLLRANHPVFDGFIWLDLKYWWGLLCVSWLKLTWLLVEDWQNNMFHPTQRQTYSKQLTTWWLTSEYTELVFNATNIHMESRGQYGLSSALSWLWFRNMTNMLLSQKKQVLLGRESSRSVWVIRFGEHWQLVTL